MIGVLGAIASISVPCLMSAIERGAQKRTMANMRAVGGAVDAFKKDTGSLPRAASIDELARALEPKYGSSVPSMDGWGRPIRYEVIDDGTYGYAISSAGKDGTWSQPRPVPPLRDLTRYFACDIVYADGAFCQSPEGIARS
ncbi:MAG: type II secretion system protein GspG [Acidobacteriota bacterium]